MFKSITGYAPAIAAIGVLTTSSFVVNAQNAEPLAEMPSVTVRYADLNLNSAAGVDALYARLRTAAREVCNVRETHGLVQAIESRKCYRHALGAAVDRVNALAPDALHRPAERGDRLAD
jgi:UrcA family protein